MEEGLSARASLLRSLHYFACFLFMCNCVCVCVCVCVLCAGTLTLWWSATAVSQPLRQFDTSPTYTVRKAHALGISYVHGPAHTLTATHTRVKQHWIFLCGDCIPHTSPASTCASRVSMVSTSDARPSRDTAVLYSCSATATSNCKHNRAHVRHTHVMSAL